MTNELLRVDRTGQWSRIVRLLRHTAVADGLLASNTEFGPPK